MVSNSKTKKTPEQRLEQLLARQKQLAVKVEAAKRAQREAEAELERERREKVIKLVESAGLFDLPLDQVERVLAGLKDSQVQSA